MTNVDSLVAVNSVSPSKKAHSARPLRPNIHQLYAWPLPLETFPIPSFFPHNPLSIIRIAFICISQVFFPPSSQPSVPYQGYFSRETNSVHITNEKTIRAFWEKGFFGKGTLSRSEPTWLDGEKRKRGMLGKETSEEITNKRRNERKKFKLERARKEREVIEQRLMEEKEIDIFPNSKHDSEKASSTGQDHHENNDSVKDSRAAQLESAAPSETNERNMKQTEKTLTEDDSDGLYASSEHKEKSSNRSFKTAILSSSPTFSEIDEKGPESIEEQEHLQLTMEEAFFLTYGLGVLQISQQDQSFPVALDVLFESFRMHSYFPPAKPDELRPDDPFLMSYVVYHHFRSLGWVVRPGIKFAVDYLLYNRGPVFSHAEFAVIILPAYSHRYYHETEAGQKAVLNKASKSWSWLHCVNRVQSQVRKSLVLVYVEIPPPDGWALEFEDFVPEDRRGGRDSTNIGRLLRRYKVREIGLKRWLPNRSKD